MLFERENAAPIADPSEKRLRQELSRLRSYGKSTFASLTTADGSYVQVAGGTVNCTVEWRDTVRHRHYRAFQDVPKVPHPDGTQLVFGGGTIVLRRDEFFFIEQVAEIFLAFSASRPFPAFVKWRDVTEDLALHGVDRP